MDETDDEVDERRRPGPRRGEGVVKVKGERVRLRRGVTGGSTRCDRRKWSKTSRAESASNTLKGHCSNYGGRRSA